MLYYTIREINGFNKAKSLAIFDEKSCIIYLQTEKQQISNGGSTLLHLDCTPMRTIDKMNFSIVKNCFLLIYP